MLLTPNRREFIQAGFWGAISLSLASAYAKQNDQSRQKTTNGGMEILVLLAPVILGEADEVVTKSAEFKENMIGTLQILPQAVQLEFSELLEALQNPWSRMLIFGVWPSWHDLNDTQKLQFLSALRKSSWTLRRSAYQAIHQIVTGAWFCEPSNWGVLSYPGPPTEALAAQNG